MGLYFAYGSNLSTAQMARRCPRAVPLGKYFLQDAKLVFRAVADCVYAPGEECPGGIWRITEECERELDRYEGVRGGHYRKEFLPISGGRRGEEELLYYAMNSDGIYPPSTRYLDGIRQGYRDFKLTMAPLDRAVKESWEQKNPTHIERQRLRRAGRPELAPRSKAGPRPLRDTFPSDGPRLVDGKPWDRPSFSRGEDSFDGFYDPWEPKASLTSTAPGSLWEPKVMGKNFRR